VLAPRLHRTLFVAAPFYPSAAALAAPGAKQSAQSRFHLPNGIAQKSGIKSA
jgi:hypothetical protein